MDQREWEQSLDWTVVGPKLIAALEEISWALNDDQPEAAADIVTKVFHEIGRDKLDAVPD